MAFKPSTYDVLMSFTFQQPIGCEVSRQRLTLLLPHCGWTVQMGLNATLTFIAVSHASRSKSGRDWGPPNSSCRSSQRP